MFRGSAHRWGFLHDSDFYTCSTCARVVHSRLVRWIHGLATPLHSWLGLLRRGRAAVYFVITEVYLLSSSIVLEGSVRKTINWSFYVYFVVYEPVRYKV